MALGISESIKNEYSYIEIKKYKVINSPKVCGDKMCSEIDDKNAKKGLTSHNVKICGDKPCYEISREPKEFTNETVQYHNGSFIPATRQNIL